MGEYDSRGRALTVSPSRCYRCCQCCGISLFAFCVLLLVQGYVPGAGYVPCVEHSVPATTSIPRRIRIRGKSFIDATTERLVVLEGTNVVVKGPPWMPSTSGDSICKDKWFTNFSCKTFNEYDAIHIRHMGWNLIRLGVVWAGAQPTPEPALDPAWLARFHAILDLCAKHGIHVLLDVHQDVVGTAVCGEGVPQWFSKLATPDDIGKPLQPLPFTESFWAKQSDGLCMANDTESWANYAGSVDYNTRNSCCIRYNQGGSSWGRLGLTWQAQRTMHYLFANAEGREYFVTYIGLLAKAVRQYPGVFGIELMNEPVSIERNAMYETWRACEAKAHSYVSDLAIGLTDPFQLLLPLANFGLKAEIVYWRKCTSSLFYAFHWYASSIYPRSEEQAIRIASARRNSLDMPVLITEMKSCKLKELAAKVNIGWSFWEYSGYCNTFPSAACVGSNETCDFGACITGYAGEASWSCSPGD